MRNLTNSKALTAKISHNYFLFSKFCLSFREKLIKLLKCVTELNKKGIIKLKSHNNYTKTSFYVLTQENLITKIFKCIMKPKNN